MSEILTVPEVAARLQLKTSWVYANAEHLGGVKLGKYWRFRWGRVLERLDEPEQDKSLGRRTNDLNETAEKEEPSEDGEQDGNKLDTGNSAANGQVPSSESPSSTADHL